MLKCKFSCLSHRIFLDRKNMLAPKRAEHLYAMSKAQTGLPIDFCVSFGFVNLLIQWMLSAQDVWMRQRTVVFDENFKRKKKRIENFECPVRPNFSSHISKFRIAGCGGREKAMCTRHDLSTQRNRECLPFQKSPLTQQFLWWSTSTRCMWLDTRFEKSSLACCCMRE